MQMMKPAKIELSAGGVIYRRRPGDGLQLLIIKDSYGNWGFPKGHIEEGESPPEGALRECREETGLQELRVVEHLGATDWYFRASGELVHKFCDHFLVEAGPTEKAKPQVKEGIQACEWLTPDEALSRITYSNARHVARLALARLSDIGEASGDDRDASTEEQIRGK